MTAHRDLTGADLHEPKGIELAQTGTSYIADGLGSGAWKLVGPDEIDTENVKNINRGKVVFNIRNVENASVVYLPFSEQANIESVMAIIDGPLTGAPSNVELKNGGLLSMGVLNLDYLSSAAGSTFVFSPQTNTVVPEGGFISFHCDGNASGTNVTATVLIDYTLT